MSCEPRFTPRLRATHLLPFLPRDVYRMSDGALVLFGSALHKIVGTLSSRVVHISPSLDAETFIDLLHAPFFDFGSISAATPGGRLVEFTAVRQLAKEPRR